MASTDTDPFWVSGQWHTWLGKPPPMDWTHLEIMRREWDEPATVTRDQIYPEMNIVGLYWRELP